MAFDLQKPIMVTEPVKSFEVRSARLLHMEVEGISFFEQFRNCLLRYLISCRLSTQDEGEIVQEAFLALFLHLDLDKPNLDLAAWVWQVFHNVALTRQDQRRRNFLVLTSSGVVDDCVIDPTPNADEYLVHIQIQEQLHSLIQKFPEQDRRCLTPRTEGLRYCETAQVLDVAFNTVSHSLACLARAAER